MEPKEHMSTSMMGTIASATAMLNMLETDLTHAPRMLMNMEAALDDLPLTWRMNTIRTAAAARLWRSQGRQTLAMHPEVVNATKLATSSKIPVEVLRALPYICPMVVYPEPPIIPTWRDYQNEKNGDLMPYRETWMRMLGFLTYSFNSPLWDGPIPETTKLLGSVDRMIKSTHDPDTEDFGLIVVFEILDETGRRVDMEATSLSMPFSQVATIDELVVDQAGRFVFAAMADKTGNPQMKMVERISRQLSKAAQDTDRVQAWFEEVYRTAVGSLLYLCSTTLDAERVPATATRKLAKTTIARKPLSLYRIGWTTGAALSKLRQERAMLGEPSEMGDISHQQDPQHRRAHFKTVWSGPGRSIPKTAFVAPYWTHRERLGEVGVNTARRVV
jgi:hypothetical protein